MQNILIIKQKHDSEYIKIRSSCSSISEWKGKIFCALWKYIHNIFICQSIAYRIYEELLQSYMKKISTSV